MNRRITGPLAWGALALVVAVPVFDILTKRQDAPQMATARIEPGTDGQKSADASASAFETSERTVRAVNDEARYLASNLPITGAASQDRASTTSFIKTDSAAINAPAAQPRMATLASGALGASGADYVPFPVPAHLRPEPRLAYQPASAPLTDGFTNEVRQSIINIENRREQAGSYSSFQSLEGRGGSGEAETYDSFGAEEGYYPDDGWGEAPVETESFDAPYGNRQVWRATSQGLSVQPDTYGQPDIYIEGDPLPAVRNNGAVRLDLLQ